MTFQEWVAQLNLTSEEKAAVVANPAWEQIYKDNVMTRSDYSRQSNQLSEEYKTKMAEADKKVQEAQDLITSNTGWKASEEKKLQQALQARQKVEQQLLRAKQKLADEYGVAPEVLKDLELDGEITPTHVTDPRQSLEDQPKYLTLEEANAKAWEVVSLNNEVRRLERQHEKLGIQEEFDPDEIINYGKQNKIGTLRGAWEQKYGVPAKREEQLRANVRKELEAEFATRQAQLESERRLAGERPATRIAAPETPFGKVVNDGVAPVSNSVAAKNARLAAVGKYFDDLQADPTLPRTPVGGI